MLKSLYDSDIVQSELKTFEKKLKLISNDSIRSQAQELLISLKEKIQDLDIGHTSHLLGEVRPSLMMYTKDEITSLRTRLDKMIKENT